MGVSGLTLWARAALPEAFVPAPAEAEHVHIDANGLVHEAIRHTRSDDAVLSQLAHRLDGLIGKTIRPTISLALALDGPAPLCKLTTQRARRLARVRGGTLHAGPSSLAITPGTPFMARVDGALTLWSALALSQRRLAPGVVVVVDPSSCAGEGESKLHVRIAALPAHARAEHVHVVVGGDSDLLLLALNAPARRVFVLDTSLTASGRVGAGGGKRRGGRLQNGASCHLAFSCEIARERLSRRSRQLSDPHTQPPPRAPSAIGRGAGSGSGAAALGGEWAEGGSGALDFALLAVLQGCDYVPRLQGFSLGRAVAVHFGLQAGEARGARRGTGAQSAGKRGAGEMGPLVLRGSDGCLALNAPALCALLAAAFGAGPAPAGGAAGAEEARMSIGGRGGRDGVALDDGEEEEQVESGDDEDEDMDVLGEAGGAWLARGDGRDGAACAGGGVGGYCGLALWAVETLSTGSPPHWFAAWPAAAEPPHARELAASPALVAAARAPRDGRPPLPPAACALAMLPAAAARLLPAPLRPLVGPTGPLSRLFEAERCAECQGLRTRLSALQALLESLRARAAAPGAGAAEAAEEEACRAAIAPAQRLYMEHKRGAHTEWTAEQMASAVLAAVRRVPAGAFGGEAAPCAHRGRALELHACCRSPQQRAAEGGVVDGSGRGDGSAACSAGCGERAGERGGIGLGCAGGCGWARPRAQGRLLRGPPAGICCVELGGGDGRGDEQGEGSAVAEAAGVLARVAVRAPPPARPAWRQPQPQMSAQMQPPNQPQSQLPQPPSQPQPQLHPHPINSPAPARLPPPSAAWLQPQRQQRASPQQPAAAEMALRAGWAAMHSPALQPAPPAAHYVAGGATHGQLGHAGSAHCAVCPCAQPGGESSAPQPPVSGSSRRRAAKRAASGAAPPPHARAGQGAKYGQGQSEVGALSCVPVPCADGYAPPEYAQWAGVHQRF